MSSDDIDQPGGIIFRVSGVYPVNIRLFIHVSLFVSPSSKIKGLMCGSFNL